MARYTIKTRTNGDMTFHVSDTGGSVRLEGDGIHHRLYGRQICDGGGFYGQKVMSDPDHLEAAARRWYRSFRTAQRAKEL
jgi:hypothetical protein